MNDYTCHPCVCDASGDMTKPIFLHFDADPQLPELQVRLSGSKEEPCILGIDAFNVFWSVAEQEKCLTLIKEGKDDGSEVV